MDLLQLLSVKNVIGFIIVVSRISGMMISAPLFSTYPIPAQVKAWLVALIAFVMYPVVSQATNFAIPTSIPEMTFFILKELGIGFLIGFIANFLFIGIQMAGQLISIQVGLSMDSILDPATQSQSSVIGEFYMLLTTMTFLCLNAHQWLFAAIYQSFIKIPPGLEMPFSPVLVDQVLQLSTRMFEISLAVVLPIFCVLFVLEVLLGVLAKMIPQMNIFMVAIPVKIYIGLALMIIFAQPMSKYITQLIQSYMTDILKMFM